MRRRGFQQVDVFTTVPYRGNPVAVVLDGSDLSDADMQAFAAWTNLSETTFVLPPTDPAADYRARIFTPERELPFAGHPTLGTCHAWLTTQDGVAPGRTVVQQCPAGLVSVRRSGDTLAFAAPPLLRSGPVSADDLAAVAAELGIRVEDVVSAAWADNGPGWVALRLADEAAVLALAPRRISYDIGVVGFSTERYGSLYEVRAFFPQDGWAVEDPVTGSLNAAVAQWLVGEGVVRPPYTVSQGTAMGREGVVHIDQDEAGTIWVGGTTTTCISGTVDL